MKKVNINRAIIDAVDETDDSLSRYNNLMMKWAKHIEKSIGSVLGYPFKAKRFMVTGCEIILPDDCYRVVMLLPGDYEDECNIRYRELGNVFIREDERTEDDIMSWIPANTTYIKSYYWEELGDKLSLIDKYDEAEVTLVYQYIETDDDGSWLVNESHIEAITKYIVYRSLAKWKYKLLKSDKLMRNTHIALSQEYKAEYTLSVRNARAEDGKETNFESDKY